MRGAADEDQPCPLLLAKERIPIRTILVHTNRIGIQTRIPVPKFLIQGIRGRTEFFRRPCCFLPRFVRILFKSTRLSPEERGPARKILERSPRISRKPAVFITKQK